MTQVPVNVVQAGGSLTPLQTKRLLCKAFRAAVKEYCALPVGKRGAFNDIFFSNLRNTTPGGAALAGSIVREAPLLMGKAVGTLPTAAALGSPAAQQVANAYAQSLANIPMPLVGHGPGGVTGLMVAGVRSCFAIGRMFASAGGAANLFRDLANSGLRLRFPDGMLGNQVLEIKGPGDSFRDGQKKDYDAASAPGSAIVVDCKSCGAAQQCKNGPSMAGGFSKGKGCK